MENKNPNSSASLTIPDTLVCRVCGEEKSINEFVKNNECKYGYRRLCKPCKNKKTSTYAKNNTEKIKEKARIYYENNKQKINEHSRVWAKNNPEKVKKTQQSYCIKNYEKRKERRRIWINNNPEKRAEYSRKEAKKLPDYYIKNELKRQGFDPSQITPDLIEVKRLLIKTKRLIKDGTAGDNL